MKRVCVFCGSNFGNEPAYRAAANDVGQELARRGMTLVYGGGSVGLMGAVADACLAAGGAVIGVLPEVLATKELLHAGVKDMRIVPSMHARKALMAELADAFIALPGGFGTFEELFEMITWVQLGLNRKPIGIYDAASYYKCLLSFLDDAVSAGFVKPKHRDFLVVDTDAGRMLDRLASVVLPDLPKWIRKDQT